MIFCNLRSPLQTVLYLLRIVSLSRSQESIIHFRDPSSPFSSYTLQAFLDADI